MNKVETLERSKRLPRRASTTEKKATYYILGTRADPEVDRAINYIREKKLISPGLPYIFYCTEEEFMIFKLTCNVRTIRLQLNDSWKDE